jgi:5-methyltetrahydrofolate--homocysteine methyltransferase
VRPARLGIQVFDDYPLEELIACIDWSPFFHAWKLPGKYPQIFESKKLGAEATRLFADAQAALQEILAGRLLRARGAIGLFAANAVGDDVEIYADASRDLVLAVVHGLRQQKGTDSGRPQSCLSDFVAPKQTGIADAMGAFVVTAGHGASELARSFERENDDYRSIMVKALADRLAEAERLTNEELIDEKYVGIRPAPGYPACPDHTEKRTLFALLDAEHHTGVTLTETFAMSPAASISGWYFAHPASCYFALGKIDRDQVADYARRKEMTVAEVERWLAPSLAYEPDA